MSDTRDPKDFEPEHLRDMPKTEALRIRGWSRPLGIEGDPVLWVHKDGSWGLTEIGPEDSKAYQFSPESYYFTADRVDSVEKLLGWLLHLTKKYWFTMEHLRQMILLYEQLHPGTLPPDLRPMERPPTLEDSNPRSR